MATISGDWLEAVKDEFKKDYYKKLFAKVSEEYKTHEELYARFTFWVWDEAYNTKGNLDLLKTINNIANNITVEGLCNIERDKESFRDAQKPDTKCTVTVYTFKIIRAQKQPL